RPAQGFSMTATAAALRVGGETSCPISRRVSSIVTISLRILAFIALPPFSCSPRPSGEKAIRRAGAREAALQGEDGAGDQPGLDERRRATLPGGEGAVDLARRKAR